MRIVSFLVGLLLRQTDGQNQGNFKSVLFMLKGVVVFSNAFFVTYRGPQKLYTAKTTQLLKLYTNVKNFTLSRKASRVKFLRVWSTKTLIL